MNFFKLDPEVAGGWGPNTEFTRIPGRPLIIHKFHYQFDGWCGDDLLESSPCYVVTEKLANLIKSDQLSGYEFRSVEVSTSDEFRQIFPFRQLPQFSWLYITGKAGSDDFGTDVDGRLVVSERALDILKKTQLKNCEISNVND